MSEKKVVRRSVAIALGIVCIILAVGIVGAIANYTSVISGKDNTISSQDSQISNLQAQNNQVQTWLDGNKTYCANEIAGKDSQITNLHSIVDLQKQEVVVSQYSVNQGAGQSSAVVARSYPYSGYLRISSTSTTSNAYINLQYWFGGKLYSFKITVGTSGEALFAILKTDSATIYVGNTNWPDGASHTLTITYYY
jgi:hypothetical protein